MLLSDIRDPLGGEETQSGTSHHDSRELGRSEHFGVEVRSDIRDPLGGEETHTGTRHHDNRELGREAITSHHPL